MALHGKQIQNTTITASKIDGSGAFDFTSGTVQVATPTQAAQAATKAYVDGIASGNQVGLDFKDSVHAATTAALSANFSAGVFTATANGAISIDGVSVTSSQRVLVKDESDSKNNGIYLSLIHI